MITEFKTRYVRFRNFASSTLRILVRCSEQRISMISYNVVTLYFNFLCVLNVWYWFSILNEAWMLYCNKFDFVVSRRWSTSDQRRFLIDSFVFSKWSSEKEVLSSTQRRYNKTLIKHVIWSEYHDFEKS